MSLAEHPKRTFHVPRSKSAVRKRSVTLLHVKTSISLEDEFWLALKAIATVEGIEVAKLIDRIDQERVNNNLSSACRLFVLKDLQKQLEARSQ